MPHHKSCEKRLRQSERKRIYNRAVRTRVRNAIKAVRSSEKDTVKDALVRAYSDLDVAVRKGVYHAAFAARMKSRLARHANRQVAA